MTALATYLGLGNTLRCRTWIQGEHDATLSVNANAYAANMETFHTSIEATYPGTPLIVIQLHSGASPTYTSVVRAQQVLFRNTHAWTSLVDCSDLTLADGLHYNADSYITVGLRIAAAYVTAAATTTITAALNDSADPVITSVAYNYTLDLNNTGAVTGSNVAAVITLPTGVVFGTATGTGWTCAAAGQVVTCTRASMATGASPTITIAVTAPSAIGANPITCTATVVADNLRTMVTDSETTTLSLPAATTDATATTMFIPQTQAEWTSLFAAKIGTYPNLAGVVAADSIWRCQEASGVLADSGSGGVALTAGGTVGYQASMSGWASKGVSFSDGVSGSFKNTANPPNPASSAQFVIMIGKITGTPAVNRNIYEGFSSATCSIRINTTPRAAAHLGGGIGTGTVDPTGSPHIFGMLYDKVGTRACGYTDQDKLAVSFTSEAGTALGIGGSVGALPPNFVCVYAAGWYAANGQLTDAQVKAIYQAMGWTITWT